MKAVFLTLLLLNLGFFGYRHWIAGPPDVPKTIDDTGIPTLTLATEAPELTARISIPTQPVEEPSDQSPELLTSVVRCVSLGPFEDIADSVQAQAMLTEDGYEPRQRVAEGQLWAGYWVHLPPLGSRQEAQDVVSRLRRAGISDTYIVPSGSSRNAVSLGVYVELSGARRRASEIEEIGFQPNIADRHRTDNVYWIDVILDDSGFIDPQRFQSEPGRITRLEVKACPAQPG